MPDMSNGWGEYSKLVLKKLDDHDKSIDSINTKITDLQVSVGKLQITNAVISGAVSLGMMVFFQVINLFKMR